VKSALTGIVAKAAKCARARVTEALTFEAWLLWAETRLERREGLLHHAKCSTPETRSNPRSLKTESAFPGKTKTFNHGLGENVSAMAVNCRIKARHVKDDDATARLVPARVVHLVRASVLAASFDRAGPSRFTNETVVS
jgi:hypothetical protein